MKLDLHDGAMLLPSKKDDDAAFGLSANGKGKMPGEAS